MITGMTQPKVSQVRRYKLQNISLERLMQALVSLDQHVEIVVQPARHAPVSLSRLDGTEEDRSGDTKRNRSRRTRRWLGRRCA
jgi:hypothetical protein